MRHPRGDSKMVEISDAIKEGSKAYLKRQNQTMDWSVIKKLLTDWKPAAIIVGIPVHDAGPNQWITAAAQAFAEQLALETRCVVHTVDERLSTVEARQALFEEGGYRSLGKEAIDAMAAKVILETWLYSLPLKN